jgi:5-methylcytosine-specific restriction endonuclease McrA
LPKKRRTFCSDKCYKENFDKFDWNTVKKKIMERDGFKCAHNNCKESKNLSVHHIKPVRQFPDLVLEPSNLITFCRYHHEFYENNPLPKGQTMLVDDAFPERGSAQK